MKYKVKKNLLSKRGLTDALGNTAILEGSVNISNPSFLTDALEDTKGIFEPKLKLTGLYYQNVA